MDDAVRLRPGEKVKIAGQYVLAAADGAAVTDENGQLLAEVTLSESDIAPPTPEKGMAWLLVDASHRPEREQRPVHCWPGLPVEPEQEGEA